MYHICSASHQFLGDMAWELPPNHQRGKEDEDNDNDKRDLDGDLDDEVHNGVKCRKCRSYFGLIVG